MELHLHPDGRVFIRDAAGNYEASLADFAADNGAAFPELPLGFVERIYAPGERHARTKHYCRKTR